MSGSEQKLRRQAVIEMARRWNGCTRYVQKVASKPVKDIETLLTWAYRQELPKVPRSDGPSDMPCAWDRVDEWLEELSLAGPDNNTYGVVPDFTAASLPHDDALLVHEAVLRLDELELALPGEWDPLGDLPDLGDHAHALRKDALNKISTIDRAGVRKLRQTPRLLVFRQAILGGAPDWEIEPPQVCFVQEYGRDKWFVRQTMTMDGAFGPVEHEIEVDGYDKKRKRPRLGAYRKTYLEPDPFFHVVARAEYEVWRAALDVLTEDLAGTLAHCEVQASGRSMQPWLARDQPLAARRVLEDVSIARPQAGIYARAGKARGRK
ncbi:hypothetical protein [Methylovirgula sp. 4M-Z18]|uniref:hypothetical protein n=1 Tax=Methylovirgula sp. 4M-Z18 TaxID=2293567 RepID=UPI000E2F2596|nr:hypothetical protein [Methylovirgula sp. 4M-Z18]RFB80416.1 hypothetical protein DYH55_02490 [Methylovirgula sp. 4M-Z18]